METLPSKLQDKLKLSYPLSMDVTAQIDAALQMDSEVLIKNAQITDFNTPAYIKDETLVYLFREFCLADNNELILETNKALLKRIQRVVFSKFPAVKESDLDEIFEKINEEFFEKILDFKSNSGDYYLIRFQDAVFKLAIGVYRKWKKQPHYTIFSEFLRKGESQEEAENGEAYLLERHANPQLSMDEKLIYRDGLNQLQEPQKTVFILRYYDDWPIESKDPGVPTLSTTFGVTSRTIRNWLKQAHDILKKWRGAENE